MSINIDQLLRRLVPSIQLKYLNQRSILDYPGNLQVYFSKHEDVELVSLFLPGDQLSEEVFWPDTLVLIGLFDVGQHPSYHYCISTVIYKLEKGKFIPIGESSSISSIFFPIYNLDFPVVFSDKYCCDCKLSSLPDCIPGDFFPFIETFVNQLDFKSKLSSYDPVLGTIYSLPFFNQVHVGMSSRTPLDCSSETRNWSALIVNGEVKQYHEYDCFLDLADPLDEIIDSMNLNPIETIEVYTGEPHLKSFKLRFEDFGDCDLEHCHPIVHLVASVCDSCGIDYTSTCTGHDPGVYIGFRYRKVLTIPITEFKIGDPCGGPISWGLMEVLSNFFEQEIEFNVPIPFQGGTVELFLLICPGECPVYEPTLSPVPIINPEIPGNETELCNQLPQLCTDGKIDPCLLGCSDNEDDIDKYLFCYLFPNLCLPNNQLNIPQNVCVIYPQLCQSNQFLPCLTNPVLCAKNGNNNINPNVFCNLYPSLCKNNQPDIPINVCDSFPHLCYNNQFLPCVMNPSNCYNNNNDGSDDNANNCLFCNNDKDNYNLTTLCQLFPGLCDPNNNNLVIDPCAQFPLLCIDNSFDPCVRFPYLCANDNGDNLVITDGFCTLYPHLCNNKNPCLVFPWLCSFNTNLNWTYNNNNQFINKYCPPPSITMYDPNHPAADSDGYYCVLIPPITQCTQCPVPARRFAAVTVTLSTTRNDGWGNISTFTVSGTIIIPYAYASPAAWTIQMWESMNALFANVSTNDPACPYNFQVNYDPYSNRLDGGLCVKGQSTSGTFYMGWWSSIISNHAEVSVSHCVDNLCNSNCICDKELWQFSVTKTTSIFPTRKSVTYLYNSLVKPCGQPPTIRKEVVPSPEQRDFLLSLLFGGGAIGRLILIYLKYGLGYYNVWYVDDVLDPALLGAEYVTAKKIDTKYIC